MLANFPSRIQIGGTTYAGDASKNHLLLLRYDEDGILLNSWAGYQTQGIAEAVTYDKLTIAPDGSVLVLGNLPGIADLDFGTLPIFTGNTGSNRPAGFVLKLSAGLVPQWALPTSSPVGWQTFTGIGTDARGRCFVAGTFNQQITFGGRSLAAADSAAGLLARISPAGQVERLWRLGTGTTFTKALAMNPQGEAVVIGGGPNWGALQFPVSTGRSSRQVVELDSNGVARRGWPMRDFPHIPFWELAVDGQGQPMLAAQAIADGTMTFGSLTPSAQVLPRGLYVARTANRVLSSRRPAEVAGLQVYPNPAGQQLEVVLGQGQAATLILRDALGRPVLTRPASALHTTLPLTGLAAGMYLLEVRQGETRSNRQVVVQP